MPIKTGFVDKLGQPICAHDVCRGWIEDDIEPHHGVWVYEQVRYFKGEWCLFDISFDYENADDEPVLLAEYHQRIEVFQSKNN